MMLDIQFDYRTLEEGIDVDGRSLEEYRPIQASLCRSCTRRGT